MLRHILTIVLFTLSFGVFGQPATDSPRHAQGTTDTTTKTFTKVDIESEFPGGDAGWRRFLSENLTYPSKAVRKKIEGTVLLQFIVGKDGSLSDIQALSGPDILKEAALKAISQSPNWKPAVQNGRKVKSYKKQPITFKLTAG